MDRKIIFIALSFLVIACAATATYVIVSTMFDEEPSEPILVTEGWDVSFNVTDWDIQSYTLFADLSFFFDDDDNMTQLNESFSLDVYLFDPVVVDKAVVGWEERTHNHFSIILEAGETAESFERLLIVPGDGWRKVDIALSDSNGKMWYGLTTQINVVNGHQRRWTTVDGWNLTTTGGGDV